jgi:NADH pyrophosphatase NudC (nudix superfamily)
MTTLEPPKETANDFAAWESDKRICLKCGEDLPEGFVAACGLKNPCPNCGHMYPLGDCSD